MNICSWILRIAGWKVNITVPDYPKCIICVAPHTSNWDFILGELAYTSIGRKAGFMMKESWFFFPLGYLFRAIGGIPVPRKRTRNSLVDYVVNKFNNAERMALAITPEGTRSRTSEWHTGFLHMARKANVPILLGAIDAGSRTIYINRTFTPSDNIERDMRQIKDFYSQFTAIYPYKFTTD